MEGLHWFHFPSFLNEEIYEQNLFANKMSDIEIENRQKSDPLNKVYTCNNRLSRSDLPLSGVFF